MLLLLLLLLLFIVCCVRCYDAFVVNNISVFHERNFQLQAPIELKLEFLRSYQRYYTMLAMSVSDDCSLSDISEYYNSEDNWEYNIRETELRRFRPETPPLWSSTPPDSPYFCGENLPPTTLRWGTTEYFKKQLETSKANEDTDMKVLCQEDNGSGEREFNMHMVIVLPQVPFFAWQASRKMMTASVVSS